MVVAATFFSQWIMNRLNNYITYRVTCNMRQQAFAKMIRLPLRDIDGHSHGDYMSRIVTDADVFSDGLLMGFTQLFTGVLTIVGTIGFMLNISVPIALVVILLTPVSLADGEIYRHQDLRHVPAPGETPGGADFPGGGDD